MKISNDFRVGVPIEEAWHLLTDIPGIAPCLPGARLTGQDGDTYEGKMKIKVGPVTAEYSGSATILEMDEANRKVLLSAKGRDSRGSGNATAEIAAHMEPDGTGTKVSIDTDLKVSGKVAQFGRGVMGDISKKLLGQFAECIEHKLATPEDDAAQVAAAGASTTETTATSAGAAADDAAGSAGAAVDTASGAVDAAADKASGGVSATGAAVGGAAVAGGAAAVAAAGGIAGKAKDAASSASTSASSFGADDDDELEALDLMDVAGGAVFKRLIPVAIAAIVIAVILWLILR